MNKLDNKKKFMNNYLNSIKNYCNNKLIQFNKAINYLILMVIK